MAHEIIGITECKLCHEKFTGPQGLIDVSKSSEHQQHRVARLMLELAQHIVDKHPEESGGIDIQAIAYQGLLRMRQFISTDQSILEQIDRFRWNVHQSTIGPPCGDEFIAGRSQGLAALFFQEFEEIENRVTREWKPPADFPSAEYRAAIVARFAELLSEGFRAMRDELRETDKYPTQQPQLVTAR